MKKQNNIPAFIKQAFYTALAICCCTACADDTWEGNNSQVKEGVPVSINLQFESSTLNKVNTRALTDEGEFQVNDLYLLIFDSKGNRKAGSTYYDTDELAGFGHTNGSQDKPTHGTLTNLKTTSGLSQIYGIANVIGNELDRKGDLKSWLDAITNVTELKALVTTLNNDGNIARSSASLLMSGAFQATNATDTQKSEGICTIPTTDSKISGTLYLRRADSHITFKIAKGNKIIDFEFVSWQVFNVPVNSYLLDQKTQYAEAKYANSTLQSTYKLENDIYSFDFYMQENLKKAITATDGTSLTSYKDREKEIKKEDKTNTGIYKYVEPNATFIELKAKMNIKPEKENELRTADVRYIIHLGGGVKDFTNFNSLRNNKYTYNITIEDVNSIIVEVEKDEDDPDARPGAEGDVVDATNNIYTLDSHYNCFNIGFTYEKIVNDFSFIIQSPFAPDAVYSVKGNIGALQNTPKDNGDYKWIQFQRANGEKTLSRYKIDDEPMSIYDLVEDMKERGRENDGRTYYYTIFINEYYYDEAPTAATKRSWKKPIWSNFVNKEDRKLLLFLSPKYSEDGESSYSKATYMIRQKSIQTYYSTEVFNESKNALGMEHINETGAPNWKSVNVSSGTWSRSNGFYNTNDYFFTNTNTSERWEKFVNHKVSPSFPYTYEMQDIPAIAECLSRNRDENGNGIIDLDELKWYLPATDQLASMFLGAKSLPSPMFDDKSISDVTYDDGKNHYITSDRRKIWAEEGCSFGGISNYGNNNYPKNLRCVRNLGMSNETAKTHTVDPAYEYNSRNNVFVMNQLTSQNKRDGKVSGELDFHDNFDDTNRPYKAFQMASSFIGSAKSTWTDIFDVDKSHRSKCKELKEGKHTWRAPNQREFMIMFLQNPANVTNGSYGFSRTHWKYNAKRHFGYNSTNKLLFLDGGSNATELYYNRTIRCVRDVNVDANGNIFE